mgnify:CR=1 FL=1
MDWQYVSILANCIIAVMAIVTFLFNTIEISKKYNKLELEFSKLQTDFAAGQVEIAIRTMISNARNNYLIAAKENSNEDAALSKQILNASLEDWLNAYDEACAKYLDCKIDKERFKKMYSVEIKRIVEEEGTKPYYDSITSSYKSTLKVYNEWNNLEG